MNRARLVKPKQGQDFESYYAVSISALCGPADKVQYRKIDTKIVGKQAAEAVEANMDAINDENKKVTCVFTVADMMPNSYDGKDGTKYFLDARLLKLKFIKVDGKVVFEHVEANAEGEAKTEQSETVQPKTEQSQASMPETEQTTDEAETTGSAGSNDTGDSDSSDSTFEYEPGETESLSKDDPDFERKKAYLKENGYRWNPESKSWVKKQNAA